MEALILLAVLAGICLIAYLLGLRDKKIQEKYLIKKLKDTFGQAPNREYKPDDLDHLQGYYSKHKEEFQIDDTTWNDLNMDGVFARMNYCLSASGEEYLYYMLRSPKQKDDFDKLEQHVDFFMNNDEERRKCQLIYSNIGRRIRYSIYDYIGYLDNVPNVSNTRHFLMIALMAVAIGLMLVNFTVGFLSLVALSLINIINYFGIKNEIEPYLASFAYILRVIYATEYFEKVKISEISEDIDKLTSLSKKFRSFTRGSFILMGNSKYNTTGNPLEIIMEYFKMALHLDLIKFNNMYKQVMDKKDDLDEIITILGRLEAEISIACFRKSFDGGYCIPEFAEGNYAGEELYHPLIVDAVANSIDTGKGLLITGSNASGKSTFLKTCAINAVMAQSIHTVLGKNYKAPIYRIYSSMALKDDIFGGDSYYIVEIKSIKRILDANKEKGAPVLCFVDEVLRGTNTVERIAASTQILKCCADNGVMCFAATHDIELTSLLKDEFDIYHFEGNVTDNDVQFDYQIKEGPATTRNAIKLLSVLGYDKTIVDDAQNLAEHFLKDGVWA